MLQKRERWNIRSEIVRHRGDTQVWGSSEGRVRQHGVLFPKWSKFLSFPAVLFAVPQRRYLRRRSACHMCLRSGKCSGILILWKSLMHFSSSSSTLIFSLAGLFLLPLVSRELEVSVRSRSLLRRCSDCCCCSSWPPGLSFLRGRSSVWTCACRLTGPRMTVPWGELASDWLSELEVESSLKEVPLSPSPSPLWPLQQQSQGGEDHRDDPPETIRQDETWISSNREQNHSYTNEDFRNESTSGMMSHISHILIRQSFMGNLYISNQ